MNKNITKLALPKSGIANFIIAGDWHSYHCHLPTVKAMGIVADQWEKNNRTLIINGDFLDAEYLMPKHESFQSNIKRPNSIEEYFLPELERECAWGNDMLDQLATKFSKIIFIEGNHCARVRWFGESKHCPIVYKKEFNLVHQLNLRKRKIDFIHYNNWLDIGQLSITHGMAHGSSACKNHYELSGGRNVIFSHVHKFEAKSFRTRGKTRRVQSLPCVSTLAPSYTRNTDNDWSQGFGTVHMKPNGHYNFFLFETWDNQIILPNGQLHDL